MASTPHTSSIGLQSLPPQRDRLVPLPAGTGGRPIDGASQPDLWQAGRIGNGGRDELASHHHVGRDKAGHSPAGRDDLLIRIPR